MENKKTVTKQETKPKESLQERKIKIIKEKLEKESGKKVIFKEKKEIDMKKVKALINLLEKYSGKKVVLKEGYYNKNYNNGDKLPFGPGDIILFNDDSGDPVKGIVLEINHNGEDGPYVEIQDMKTGHRNSYSTDMASTAKVIKKVNESKRN